jgi:hypothetical protein
VPLQVAKNYKNLLKVMLLLKKQLDCLTNLFKRRKREKKKKRKEKKKKKERKLQIGILYSKKTHFLKKIIQSFKIYNLFIYIILLQNKYSCIYMHNFITKLIYY